jgi:mRNA-degrading endonuclease RelE of RelBE toxin-antitoxin system
MKWELLLAGPATKALKRMPAADRRRVLAALDSMEQDPFSGDIVRLTAQPVAWRRRVGDWRILFDVELEQHRVLVHGIVRRTSTTY